MSDVSSVRSDTSAAQDSMSIPIFPDWRPWGLEDRHTIEALTASLDAPYSDVHFASCFAWDADSEARWTTLNGNLVMQLPDYATREPVTVLAGADRAAESALILLSHPDIEALSLVPECVAAELRDEPSLIVKPDRDNFDYVYDIAAGVSMEGKRWSQIRTKRNRFRRDHPDAEILTTQGSDNTDRRLHEELLRVFDVWANGPVAEDPTPERAATANLLRHAGHFDLQIVRVRIDGQTVGFNVTEILPDGWACGHFEKADRDIAGLYAELRIQTFIALMSRGAGQVNWEQDLGITGLRTYKTWWHPSRMLQKHTVTR